jgi:hypothetical protein
MRKSPFARVNLPASYAAMNDGQLMIAAGRGMIGAREELEVRRAARRNARNAK